jgi:hypothetical protein
MILSGLLTLLWWCVALALGFIFASGIAGWLALLVLPVLRERDNEGRV